MGRTQRWIRTIAVALLAAAALAAWSPLAAAAGPRPSAAPVSPGGRPGGRLSPRLAQLARSATGSTSRSARAAENRAARLPSKGAGSLLRRDDGRILVRLRLSDLSPRTRSAVSDTGASFVADGHDDATATVAIAPDRLGDLGALPALRWAQEELTPRINADPALARSAARAALAAPATAAAAACPSGIVSEGDTQLKAAAARIASGVSGAGVKVGVMSDSYNALGGAATDVANGELPGPGNPCGFTTGVQNLGDYNGGRDEGRAMAQIVHDLAPGASLAFRTAFNGEQDFANGIRALRDAGATIIVDDVSYDDEPMFQDGVIAAAIDEVKATGVTYFSSAANSNFRAGGNEVGSYEAPQYRPMLCPSAVLLNDGSADCHDFDPSTAVNHAVATDQLTVPGNSDAVANDENQVRVALGWSQPEFGITTDFDVYLLDPLGTIVASTVVPNLRSGEANEILDFANNSGVAKNYRLVIARSGGTGTPRIKVIFNRPSAFTAVQWNTSSLGDVIGPTTYGHNAPLAGASVAATPFDNSSAIEGYSSRGPALYCWQPVRGTMPAAVMNPCQVKQIDFAATDGGKNSFFGSDFAPFRFYGTSAAAPHAAAIAALQRQRQPCRTPAELVSALRASGRPVGPFQADAAGSGLLDATTAISSLAQCPPTAPATPAISSATRASATIHWGAPASLGSAITSYRITVYAAQSATTVLTINTGTTALSATISGLTAGTLYRFRVAATNAAGTGAASGYSTYVTPPFSSLAAFTTQQYEDFAGRPPTSAELNAADAALAAGTGGTTPASQIATATAFANWGPNVDGVTRLYYAFFQRPPDSGGLSYWSGRRRSGAALDVVANSFAASTEFQHTYGSLTNQQFVELVYNNVLGRAGDASGVAFWTGQLDQHKRTRGQVMIGFSESGEHKHRRAGEVNTIDVFFGMLRRVPTTAERTTWAPQTATSELALVNFLLGSVAYDARV